jgi:hypothetical protein
MSEEKIFRAMRILGELAISAWKSDSSLWLLTSYHRPLGTFPATTNFTRIRFDADWERCYLIEMPIFFNTWCCSPRFRICDAQGVRETAE